MWGVHILHEKYNLIHRALSPSNILIDQNHQLKIVNYSSCTYCYDENGKIIEYSDLKYLNRGYETGRKEI
jgi:serine/threonine protein kinase